MHFPDWELDDCEEPVCSDDVLPYPIVSSTPKNSIPNKLTFYTIGAYDIDTNSTYLYFEQLGNSYVSRTCYVLISNIRIM